MDTGAERCFADAKAFCWHRKDKNLGYVAGVAGRLPVVGHGFCAEMIEGTREDGRSVVLLVIFYAQHCPDLPCQPRSGDAFAFAGIKQTVELSPGAAVTTMTLSHTAADGTRHDSVCDRQGQLFVARLRRVATSSEVAAFCPVDQLRNMTIVLHDTAPEAPLRRLNTSVRTSATATTTQALYVSRVLFSTAFQNLHATMGGADKEATIRMLQTWETQELAVGQPTQRTRCSRRDAELVRQASIHASARASPLRPVDTPEMRAHVGSEPVKYRLGGDIGLDHPGGLLPVSQSGHKHPHIILDFGTDSVHVTVHKTKHPTEIVAALGEASRRWELDWDLTSHNFNADTRLYHDDATCHQGECLAAVTNAGFQDRPACPCAKYTAQTGRIEKQCHVVASRARFNLWLAVPACKLHGVRVRSFWPQAFLCSGGQGDLVPDRAGRAAKERRTGVPVTRAACLRAQPTHFFGEGTRAVDKATRSRIGDKTEMETGNTTLADRGDIVYYLYTDQAGRWMVYSFTERRILPCINVTWHATCAPPPPPSLPAPDLDMVDWEKVSKQRALAAHVLVDPLEEAALPLLSTLSALTAAIDMENNPHASQPEDVFAVPTDDNDSDSRSLLAAVAIALEDIPDKDLTVASTVAFAHLASVRACMATAAPDATTTVTTTGGACPPDHPPTGGHVPLQFACPASSDGSTAPPTGMGAAAARRLIANLSVDPATPAAVPGGGDVCALRAEVFAACEKGRFHKSAEPFLPEFGGVSNETKMLQLAGNYALMQSSSGLHIIDITDIDALVAAKEQLDPREKVIDLVSHDDLRIAKSDGVPMPKNIEIALKGPFGSYWQKAHEKELSSFKEGVTFTRCRKSHLPKGARVCSLMMVLDRKYNDLKHPTRPGLISRLKCRLVVLGHRLDRKEGEVTASTMPRLPSVRLLDHIAVKADLATYSADVACAFLEGRLGELDQDIYVKLPPYLQPLFMSPDGEPEHWHLRRSCHGLRTASHCWQATLNDFLLRTDKDSARWCPLPLKRSQHESCLCFLDTTQLIFAPECEGLRTSLVGPPATESGICREQRDRLAAMRFCFQIFVDDSRVHCSRGDATGSATPTKDTGAVLNDLFMLSHSKVFTVTGGRTDLHADGAPPEEYLKMLIEYKRQNGFIRSIWNQDAALRKFLKANGAENFKKAPDAPMDKEQAKLISKDNMPKTDEAKDAIVADLIATRTIPAGCTYATVCTEYRSQVASANWFACSSYPMLSYAVSRLSVQMHAPTAVAVRAMKRLLRFMTTLDGKHLHYRRGETDDIILTGQSDASLGDADYGRSQFGWTCSLDDRTSAVFDWRSGKTALTIVSTCGTELYALSELARSIIGWRMLIAELGFPIIGPTTVYTDSTSAMINANHYATQSKSRSVRLRSWFVRECVVRSELKVCWRSGKELHADGLTKATSAIDYQRQQDEAHGIIR